MLIKPIRNTGANRDVEVAAFVLLIELDVDLGDPSLASARPDGALHMVWRQGPNVLKVWFRCEPMDGGMCTSWETGTDGRRTAQGHIRQRRRDADIARMKQAIHLYQT